MGLNLLPSQAKFQAERNRMMSLSKKVMIFISAVWLGLTVVVLGWWWMMNGLEKKANDAYLLEKNNYQPQLTKIALGQQLKDRLKTISAIVDSRFEYGRAFKKITGLFSDNIKVVGIDISDKKSFTVKAMAPDSQAMNEVENRVADINSGKVSDFSSMAITTLVWEGGNWNIEFKVGVNNAK